MVGIIIAGLPASGKGTQCNKLAETYGLAHVNIGENLRHEVKRETAIGKEAENHIKKGKLVPDALVKEVMDKLLSAHEGVRGFIFDGFPRSVEQAKILSEISVKHGLQIKAMIYLQVDEEEITKRIQKRAKESDRNDDQDPAVVKQRIDRQRKEISDLITFYQKEGIYYKVDGKAGIDEVFKEIKGVIENNQLLID